MAEEDFGCMLVARRRNMVVIDNSIAAGYHHSACDCHDAAQQDWRKRGCRLRGPRVSTTPVWWLAALKGPCRLSFTYLTVFRYLMNGGADRRDGGGAEWCQFLLCNPYQRRVDTGQVRGLLVTISRTWRLDCNPDADLETAMA